VTEALQSTQLKSCEVVALPVLTSAHEKWTLNPSGKKKIVLRPVAGYTLLDQERSTGIRSELKIFHLTGNRKANRKLVGTYI
jgi:hypothetical protein